MAAVGRDHFAGEGIVLADEGGDEGGLRVLVDLGAGADLLDDALAHHRDAVRHRQRLRSEEHTSELQSLMRISYAVFCLKKKRLLLAKNDTTRNDHQLLHNT